MIIKRLFSRAFSTAKGIMTKAEHTNSFVWIDLELTGLNINKDKILEIACIITKTDLNPVHEGINLIIHQPDNVLAAMNDWCLVHHEKTGLTQASRESKISLTEAEQKVADYIKSHTNPEGTRYLAGNSVYMDKFFLEKHMPSVDSLLHYRIVDVSSFKTVFSHWYPDELSKLPPKNTTHRALSDIRDSIKELKDIKDAFFKF